MVDVSEEMMATDVKLKLKGRYTHCIVNLFRVDASS